MAHQAGKGRRGHGAVLWQGALIAAVGLGSLGLNARLAAPPRYDGAGYAVLARSLRDGTGYREVDHPDAPRHAHFPPGYPLVLAALWNLTGPSPAAARGLSIACTLGAILLMWAAYRRWHRPAVALALGLALAVNWRWGRDGSAIQSEPLFLLIASAIVLASGWVGRRGGVVRGVALGGLVGAAVLVRHVGIGLAAAVLLDLISHKRRREAVATAAGLGVMVAPWVGWLLAVRRNTQAGLLPGRGLADVAAGNALFYDRRLPDQWWGPAVEVATVFRPSWSAPATAAATVVSLAIVGGWLLALRSRRRRLAGSVPLATMAVLLAWPFTEAGRFLVPLVPFLLDGLVEAAGAWTGWRRARTWAAWGVLAGSLPYSLYAIASRRADAAMGTHAAFDAACAAIAHRPDRPGPVLSRHPGEVFWQTGRKALAPPEGASADEVAALIDAYGAAFLLVDRERYANAPPSPIESYVAARPDRARPAWKAPGNGSVVVYEIVPPRKPD